MNIERKYIYLSIAAVFMALLTVPSALFVDTFKRHFGFLQSWSTGLLRQSKVSHMPPTHTEHDLPDIKFVKISVRHPNAAQINVAADFNQWNPKLLPLEKNTAGIWETIVPLPPGRYHYLLEIDGTLQKDPGNRETETTNGKTTSILLVK